MKKILALFLASIISVLTFSAETVNAEDYDTPVSDPIIEEYQFTLSASSVISTSGNTAYCSSSAVGKTGVYKISGAQFLEKKVLLAWVPVDSWTDYDDDNTLEMHNSKSGLASGTYHVRTSFIVYSGNSSETITVTGTSATI